MENNPFVCWSCAKPLPPFERNQIPFRATCDFCGADLHVCKNCRNWAPGKPNECLVPGTEWVADRERANLCEEFNLRGEKPQNQGPSQEEIARRLFRD